MPIPSGKNTELIPELTGVRFFLALSVVVFHFGQPAFLHAPAIVRNVMASGYSSVSMFFALSGYVLARTYRTVKRGQYAKFWIARVARIAPAYWTAVAVMLPFYAYSSAVGGNLKVTA